MNMTHVANPDIRQRKPAPTKYNSDSYRIFGEQAPEQENTPFRNGHARPAPFYTDPNTHSSPPQGLETGHNPYATRAVDTNAIRSNAAFGSMRHVHPEREEGRWWDWSQTKTEPNRAGGKRQDEQMKIKENSYQNIFNNASDEQNPYTRKNSRYSANPQHIRAVGIVPITDLKSDDFVSANQRHAERVPNEEQYNNRNPPNYPRREQQYDAFPVEQPKPPAKPMNRSQSITSAKVERAGSMWDLFHPHQDTREPAPNNSRKYQQPLPQIKRTEKYDGAWPNAPYASDYQLNHAFNQPPDMNQLNVD